MAVVQTAMLSGMPYSKLREAIFAHPTMAEGLGFLLANVPTRSMQVGYSVSSCPSMLTRPSEGCRRRHLQAPLA